MKKQKLEEFKVRLLKEKNHTLESLNLMKEIVGDREEFSKELSTYDNHPADIGTELFMLGQNIALENNSENILYKIENALDSIKSKNYGVCEACRQKIDMDRLNVLPYASKCLQCESEYDNDSFLGQETNRYFNFSRTFADDEKSSPVIYDGEDTWQDVNECNIVKKDPSYGTMDYVGLVDEDELGCVEEVEKISEDYYRKQL